jgi:2-polyprenyl-3-methyl-5-hydroxy-6-metoxy-1,4-benzoquinol methylase
VEADACINAARGALALVARDARCEVARVTQRARSGWIVEDDRPRRRAVVDRLLAVVVRIERGDVVLDLTRRTWRVLSQAACRMSLLAPLLRTRMSFERVRRPLFPPLDLGGESALIEGVRDAYDLESSCWSTIDGLRPEEEMALARHLKPGMRLLDVGCGAGREAIAFARAGLDVIGIDFAPSMIDAARVNATRMALDVRFELADVRTFVTSERYDAIYLGPEVYEHVFRRARRETLLRQVAKLLRPGGLLMVSVAPAPKLSRLSRARLVDTIRRLVARWASGAVSEPGDHLTRGFAVAGRRSLRYFHRFAGASEIEAELTMSGLVLRDRIDDQLWILSRLE